MTRGLFILFILSASLLAASCKKEKPAPGNSAGNAPGGSGGTSAIRYFPLKTGNYWIYERFTDIDSLVVTGIDSCYVAGEQVIGGKKYFILAGSGFAGANHPRYLRDSLYHILNDTGFVVLSTSDFSSFFWDSYVRIGEDTIYHTRSKMGCRDSMVRTPAGEFSTISMVGTHTIFPNYHVPGTRNPKHNFTVYGFSIGPVYESAEFLTSDGIVGRRLIRYKLGI